MSTAAAWTAYTSALEAHALQAAPALHPRVEVEVESGRIYWRLRTTAWPGQDLVISEKSTAVGNATSMNPVTQAKVAAEHIAAGSTGQRLRLVADAYACGADPGPLLAAHTAAHQAAGAARLAAAAVQWTRAGWPWPPEWATREAAVLGVPVPLGADPPAPPDA